MPTLQVGPARTFKTPTAAIQAAKAGDVVAIDAGKYGGKDAVAASLADNLTITAVGGRVELSARDATNTAYNVYGHGILSLNGKGSKIDGIDFVGAAVPDKNGAGIRIVGGGTHIIRNCTFVNNENGILTANPTDGVLIIEDNIFGRNGFGDGQSHQVYIGKIARLEFRRNISLLGNKGQGLKSRAAVSIVEYNVIGDREGATNYEADFSNGGDVAFRGNLVLQGPNTANGYMLVIGTEGALHPVSNLLLESNTFMGYRSVNYFVQTFNGVPLSARNNLFGGQPDVAKGVFMGSALTVDAGNVKAVKHADLKLVADADYRPTAGSPAAGVAVAPVSADQIKFPYPLTLEPRVTADAGAFAVGASTAYAVPAIPAALPAPAAMVKVPMGPVVVPPVVTPPAPTPASGEQKITISHPAFDVEITARPK